MASDFWRAAAFATVLPALALCALYALAASLGCGGSAASAHSENVEDFITARDSVGGNLLAFSFYAGVMGSWVITGPAIYSSQAGLLGLSVYAASCGAPLVVVSYAGVLVRSADPCATSLPDFLQRRFGPCAAAAGGARGLPLAGETQVLGEGLGPQPGGAWAGKCVEALAVVVILLVMSISLLAEYAALGTLFRAYVGCRGFWAVVPTLVMAALTMSYTVAGGLYVSILTDRLQAVVSVLLILVLATYLPSFLENEKLPPLTAQQKGFSYEGFSSILSMPVALVSSTVCSEALWQRVWASENNQALRRAAWLGSAAVSLVTFFFGFIGFLALWSERATSDTDPNLYFFAFFSTTGGKPTLDSVPGLAALLCAAMMSEGAVDSFQNGIAGTLSSTLLRGRSLWATRALVLFVNVPLALFGASPQVNNVLDYFLLSNIATVCCLGPLMLAMLPGPRARELVSELSVVVGCLSGAIGVTAYGCLRMQSLSKGVYMAWMGNGYGWDYFVAAMASSAVGTLAGMLCSQACCRPRLRAKALHSPQGATGPSMEMEPTGVGGALSEPLSRRPDQLEPPAAPRQP